MSYKEIIEGLTFQNYGQNDTAITINNGDFKGVTFKFGRTWFPDPDQPIMSFEYDLLSEAGPSDAALPEFRVVLGNILQNLLLKAMESQGVVYTGGTGPSEIVEVIEGDGSDYLPPPTEPSIIRNVSQMNKLATREIMLPENYKVPEPEYGTRMSRNLLDGL